MNGPNGLSFSPESLSSDPAFFFFFRGLFSVSLTKFLISDMFVDNKFSVTIRVLALNGDWSLCVPGRIPKILVAYFR